jgi:hypothetical protein
LYTSQAKGVVEKGVVNASRSVGARIYGRGAHFVQGSGVADLVDSAANSIARRVDKLKEGGCIS